MGFRWPTLIASGLRADKSVILGIFPEGCLFDRSLALYSAYCTLHSVVYVLRLQIEFYSRMGDSCRYTPPAPRVKINPTATINQKSE